MKNLLILFCLLICIKVYAREVEFSWAPMPQALKYEIQVSKTAKFEKILATQVLEKPTYVTKLDVGRYFYRVRVIDIKGRPGKWSAAATVLIDPYSPELISPENGFETSYFEILPIVKFEWKTPQDKMSYEILIAKATGEKVLELKVNNPEYTTQKLPEGDYTWKVRTVTENISSGYTEPRRFNIKKKELQPPRLITPEAEGVAASYRAVNFTWEQDPNTHFTDITYEKIKSYTVDGKLTKNKHENLTGTAFKDPYQEPGLYKWWVTTKEAKNTPGVSSEIQNFELRGDVLSAGNYELEFSMSYADELYTTTSARQTLGLTQVSQQTQSSGMFVGFLGGYYVFESLGFFISQRTAKMSVENFSDLLSETDFQLRCRFGSRGFSQEFILGYRMMDLIEAENSPVITSTAFTTYGGLLGTRISASLSPVLKTQFNIFYFKPTSNIQSINGLVADVYGGSLGLKWNFMYQFWLGYRFSMERIVGSFQTPGQPPSQSAAWTQYRTEPIFISIGFEH
jgi:hypothetical protein